MDSCAVKYTNPPSSAQHINPDSSWDTWHLRVRMIVENPKRARVATNIAGSRAIRSARGITARARKGAGRVECQARLARSVSFCDA